jgi:hypothetical protein
MLGIGRLSTVICIRTDTLLLNVHAMQMQQSCRRRRRRENNLASTLKCVLNVESGVMQPSILLLSYMIQIPKISQGNVTRD